MVPAVGQPGEGKPDKTTTRRGKAREQPPQVSNIFAVPLLDQAREQPPFVSIIFAVPLPDQARE